VAAFNLYPSSRGSELDDIDSSAIQVLDPAPLHWAPIWRVTKRADQLHGKGLGLAGHCGGSGRPIAARGARGAISVDGCLVLASEPAPPASADHRFRLVVLSQSGHFVGGGPAIGENATLRIAT
jgi:hypothetical protein